jgi:hypothetical protein
MASTAAIAIPKPIVLLCSYIISTPCWHCPDLDLGLDLHKLAILPFRSYARVVHPP